MNNKKSFNGFYPETIQFMLDLGMNNYKTWFEEHRSDYEKYLLEPMKNLVTDLAETMLSIDPQFETTPKVDRTISRIYRDTRFSKDKSPYRNNMWITFRRRIKNWQDHPCFFFELMLEGYRFGMGYYSASIDTMKAFRKKVNLDHEAFLDAIKPIGSYFDVEGDDYKKPFPGSRDKRIDSYYNKKSFYLTRSLELDDLVFSSGLADEIIKNITRLKNLYNYLVDLQD